MRGEIRFDTLPEAPYPGYNLDHGLAFNGGHIGEHFAGQSIGITQVDGAPFDSLTSAQPQPPLALRMGAPGATLSVSRHRVFRSNVLYPLGPLRQPHPDARGEGMVAFWFDDDICQFGAKVHTQFTDDLGTDADHLGEVEFLFFARNGQLISRELRRLPPGVSKVGFGRENDRPDIAGVQVVNRDPGGITLDDVLFGCQPFVG